MPPRLSEPEIERLRVLYEESQLSVLALVRETGYSNRTVYYYASRRGWRSRAARRGPRLPRAEIRSLYENTIVPVAEIARLAAVAVPTIHVWAAKEGWKPRATRLRRQSAGSGEINDLAAEVANARERAERVQDLRTIRASGLSVRSLLQVAREHRRDLKRARRGRSKKGSSNNFDCISPQELAERLNRSIDMRRRDGPPVVPHRAPRHSEKAE